MTTPKKGTTVLTLTDVETRYGVSHHDHLDREVEIPTVTTLAFQGDVAIIRRDDLKPAATPLPKAGFPAVRGENGGNTHLLVGDGCYDQARSVSAAELRLGVVTVPDGGTTLLSHPEHGGLLLAPGTYELRRQREQADELRLVAD